MKREAQKIVEAQLNDALNRNDSKAVREACIVLKALSGPAHLAECEVIVTTGLEEGKTEPEITTELQETGCTKEEAFDIYWRVKNETEDSKRMLKNPEVTEEIKTEVDVPVEETPVE